MKEKLKIDLSAPSELRVETKDKEPLSLQLTGAVGGTTDYERLKNKPSINGVTLSGALSSQSLYIVSENTELGWSKLPTYIPKKGEIVYYTDIPAIKVGDGNAYVVDLPFADRGVYDMLISHVNDFGMHVTPQEKAFWNNKLNCNYNVSAETLILDRN